MRSIIKFLPIFSLFLLFGACSSDPIYDTKLEKSDFFVSFRTYNGVFASATITEGDTAIVAVSIGATKGAPVTVDLSIVLPEVTNDQSKAYKLLDMSNNQLSSMLLTFPEGTGTQEFKFVALDNDLTDGTRKFTLGIKSNSAGYNIGIGKKGEAATFPVTVKDDEIPIVMSEIVGEWTVNEELYYSSKWNVEEYKVTISEVGQNQIEIVGLSGDGETVVNATVDLASKVKTITIPGQKITPSWNSGYDTYFSAYGANPFPGGFTLPIQKEEDGKLTVSFGSSYAYEFAAVTIGTQTRLGQFITSYATKLTKLP